MEVKKIAWSDPFDSILLPVLGEDLAAIKAEVKRNRSELWEIVDSGYLVTRIEPDLQGKPEELVFVAAIGRNAKPAFSYFKELAKAAGIKFLRVHSQRPGMQRWLKELGFYQAEIIYRAVVE